jgi:hypothetical protein
MSKQVGLVKLKGNMDGISFFQSEGQHLARMANGPSKERIRTDARFERTRENNNEFGGSALMGKAFRQAFSPVMSMADPRFSARLTSVFKEINLQGAGARGKRPITLSQHGVHLTNLEFNVNRSVSNLFTGLIAATNSADRYTATITIDDVLLRKVVKVPEGATHVQFTQAIGVLSDYVFNEALKKYVPVDANVDKMSVVTDSAFISIADTPVLNLAINTVLPTTAALNGDVSIVQCFGVSFYQQVEADFYPLLQGSAIKVARVF